MCPVRTHFHFYFYRTHFHTVTCFLIRHDTPHQHLIKLDIFACPNIEGSLRDLSQAYFLKVRFASNSMQSLSASACKWTENEARLRSFTQSLDRPATVCSGLGLVHLAMLPQPAPTFILAVILS